MSATENDSRELRLALVQRLESLRRSGLTELPQPFEVEELSVPLSQPEPVTAPREEPVAERVAPAVLSPENREKSRTENRLATAPNQNSSAYTPSDVIPHEQLSLSQQNESLTVLRQEVAACTQCRELASTRTQTVFGVGDPGARLVFVGEAPGGDEDRQGEPFVGAAGQLLDKIIAACTLRREDVYILNTLKCRPPGNRDPSESELSQCHHFLDRQLDIIRPEYICCLGGVAAKNLLSTDESVGRLRGRIHLYRGIKVMATYHPAHLLRTPTAKRMVWSDMQMLMNEMGIELP